MGGRTEDPRRVKAVEGIVLQLKRTLNLYRLYGVCHELAVSADRALFDQVEAAIDAHGELGFTVAPPGLLCGEVVVLPEEDKDESLSRTLLTDGVEAVRFVPPARAEELRRFAHLWFETLTQGLDDEHSFATAIWEAELEHVDVRIRSDLAESGVPDEAAKARTHHAARLLASFRAPQGAVRVEASALDVIRSVDAFASLTKDELDARAEAARASLEPLSAVDRAALVSGLAAGGRGAGQRTLLGLDHVLPRASQTQRPELLGLMQSILHALVSERRTREVVRALTRVQDDAAAGGRVAPMFELLAAPEIFEALVAQLEDPKLGEDAAALLGLLPRAHVALIAGAIEDASAARRARLVAQLEARRPDPIELSAWVIEGGSATAQAILPIAERCSPRHRDLVLRALLVHPRAEVRVVGAIAVRTEEVAHHRTLLLEVMKAGAPQVRQSILQSLIRAKEPVAAEMLSRALDDANSDPPMIRTAIQGLAAIGGARARQALLHVFVDSKVAEYRRASALALAAVADEQVVNVLQAEAKRLLGEREVKEACRTALERIRSREVHS